MCLINFCSTYIFNDTLLHLSIHWHIYFPPLNPPPPPPPNPRRQSEQLGGLIYLYLCFCFDNPPNLKHASVYSLVYPFFPAHLPMQVYSLVYPFTNPLAHTGVYSLVYPFTSPPVSIHWSIHSLTHLPTHLFTGLSLHQLTCPHVYSLVYPLARQLPTQVYSCLKTSFSITLLLIFMAQKPFQGSPVFLMPRVSMAGNPFQGSITLPWLLGRSRFHGM